MSTANGTDIIEDYLCRLWEAKDRDSVCSIIKSVIESLGYPYFPHGRDQDLMVVEKYYFEEDRGEFWVIEKDKKIVGSGAFMETEKDGERCAYICRMYLLPEVRGQGLGRAMLQLLEKRIERRGCRSIYIETAASLKEALKLYYKSGYKKVDLKGAIDPRAEILLFKPLSQKY